MKKYVSMILAAVLSASLLAGCGGSGSSGQQSTEKAQETAVKTEETKEAKEAVQAESAAQTKETKEAGQAESAARTDAAGDDAKADAAADTYLVYVLDAETMAPIPGARVQFCSDVMCRMAKTDDNGMAAIHSDDAACTVHFMKAPDGYEDSSEEFTLGKDDREATYFLNKQGQASGAEAASGNTGSTEPGSEMDFPYTGFTFDVPEELNKTGGEIMFRDHGEVGVDSGVVIGYVAYQAKTEADFMEFLDKIGVHTMEDATDEKMAEIQSFYDDSPTLMFFRVMGVRGEQDLDQVNKEMFDETPLVFDEVGTAGDYKFYYVVLHDEKYYEELRNTSYPQDKLEEAYRLWQEAATTDNFKKRITVKEPESPFSSVVEGASVSFETKDLEGHPVTSEELFAGHKITMINIWATWCINCISEMEELEALNKEWAEKGCQIIGICDDAADDAMIPGAKKILEEHGVTFRNVCMSEKINEQLPAVGLPTSYFVDSEGKILCSPITGKHVEQYTETLQKLLP